MFTKKELEVLNSAFDKYVKAYCETLPTNEELSYITFSPEFEARMQKLIEKQRKFYYYWFNTVGKRVAAVVVSLIIAATATTFSVRALREQFISFIVETFKKFTSITMVDDEASSTVEMTFEIAMPNYIPEGYTIESQFEGESFFRVCYIKEDKTSTIMFVQNFDDGTITTADTENTEYKKLYIKDYEGLLCSNKGENILIFNDGTYTYSLSSPINESELIKMAESIVEN